MHLNGSVTASGSSQMSAIPALKKTVAVLGASYGGIRAAQVLVQGLPKGWRVLVVDRNTHMNHLYVMPRYAVLPGHEHKAFIPYIPIFRSSNDSSASLHLLHASVTSLSPNSLTLSRAFPEHGIEEPNRSVKFDYAVYALGSHLPAPINLWGPVGDKEEPVGPDLNATENIKLAEEEERSLANATGDHPRSRSPSSLPLVKGKPRLMPGTKPAGMDWLKRFHQRIEKASSILVVGGGPLGVQYATDIADVFPNKHVTLLHSRPQLLPLYEKAMHDEIMSTLAELNITAILGDRLDMASIRAGKTTVTESGKQERIVRTLSGREIHAELVILCTGQKPNTGLLAEAVPSAVIPEGPKQGLIRVTKTMQVGVPAQHRREGDGDAFHGAFNRLDISRENSHPQLNGYTNGCQVNGHSKTNDHVKLNGENGNSKDAAIDGESDLNVPYPHLFAIGDAADAFGAINSGRNSYLQAEIAARNIIKLIEQAELQGPTEGPKMVRPELEEYAPDKPMIKISLGLKKSVYQVEGNVNSTTDCADDLDVHRMWQFFGLDTEGQAMHE